MKPVVAVWGPQSKIKEQCYYRITRNEDWFPLWERHLGKRFDKYYCAEMPHVDFERYMALALFAGPSFNNDGLSTHEVIELANSLLIRIEPRVYSSMAPGTQGHAYGFVVLPKSKKKIIIEFAYYSKKSDPPQWTIKKTFEAITD